MSGRIRLLVVEDHHVVRAGLVSMIGQQADMEVAAEASNGVDAVSAFQEHRPDVTLMDLRMPRMDGFEATRKIRALAPDALVLVLTSYEGDEDAYRALEAGAKGYVLKEATREEMLGAIRGVAAGKRWIASAVASTMAESMPRVQMTEREMEVLRLMARGESNKEIAKALAIAESTVKIHASSILRRLEARDRTEAVMIALKRGILHT